MKLQIKTENGSELIVVNGVSESNDKIIFDGKETENFAFVAPNMEELISHFINSDETDFAVGIRGANSITGAEQDSLMSILFKKTNNIMPLGELTPNYVPEITSVLIASFQNAEDHIDRGTGIITVTDFTSFGRVSDISVLEW